MKNSNKLSLFRSQFGHNSHGLFDRKNDDTIIISESDYINKGQDMNRSTFPRWRHTQWWIYDQAGNLVDEGLDHYIFHPTENHDVNRELKYI